MVWCITCLADGSRESAPSSGKSNRQEFDSAGRVNTPTGSSPHFVVAKARTLPWPSLAGLNWESSSCTTGLIGALCTATIHSLSSFFRFPSASSSRHLSSFLCQTVAIWNRLPYSVISSTSLSSLRSAVRRYFISGMFSYGLS